MRLALAQCVQPEPVVEDQPDVVLHRAVLPPNRRAEPRPIPRVPIEVAVHGPRGAWPVARSVVAGDHRVDHREHEAAFDDERLAYRSERRIESFDVVQRHPRDHDVERSSVDVQVLDVAVHERRLVARHPPAGLSDHPGRAVQPDVRRRSLAKHQLRRRTIATPEIEHPAAVDRAESVEERRLLHHGVRALRPGVTMTQIRLAHLVRLVEAATPATRIHRPSRRRRTSAAPRS